MSVNKVILVGNVGHRPLVKQIDENLKVASFSMATSENYKDKAGNKVTSTEWHNIVAWRGLANIAESFIKKGTQVFIEGKIKNRSYEANDGTQHYITEIIAEAIHLLGRKPEGIREIPPETKDYLQGNE